MGSATDIGTDPRRPRLGPWGEIESLPQLGPAMQCVDPGGDLTWSAMRQRVAQGSGFGSGFDRALARMPHPAPQCLAHHFTTCIRQ
jgi:hypothetical protein